MQSNTLQPISPIQQLIPQPPVAQSPSMHPAACSICPKPLTPLISHSLFCKYASFPNMHQCIEYAKAVDEILGEAISANYIAYRDYCYFDDQDQNMKRSYEVDEFGKKIAMLGEYYRYHRNLPTWNDKNIEPIMERHYTKVKDVDYKKVKEVLKKQQGISLTTQKSFSSMDEQSFTKKSRYSALLHDLQKSQDSILLKDMCDRIGNALQKVKAEVNFKGVYYSGEKKFQQFLQKQKKRRQITNKNSEETLMQSHKFTFKKIRQSSESKRLTSKTDQSGGLKQIVFPSNHSLKQRRYMPIKTQKKSQKSQKQTLSIKLKYKAKLKQKQKIVSQQNMETATKRQKNKLSNQKYPVSSRNSICNKDHIANENFNSQHFHNSQNKNKNSHIENKLKSIKKFALAQPVSYANQNFGLINQRKLIKKQGKNMKLQIPISSTLIKSASDKNMCKIKSRSNSSHNIRAINNLAKDLFSKDKDNTKSARSSSKKSIPISVAKGSVIQLGNLKNKIKQISRQNTITQKSKSKSKSKDKLLTKQNSSRILRTNSSNKIQSSNNMGHIHNIKPTISRNSLNKQVNIGNIVVHPHPHPHPHPNPNPYPHHTYSQSQQNLNINLQHPNSQLSCSKNGNSQKIFGKKRNSAVENILQKKLTAFKKKQHIY